MTLRHLRIFIEVCNQNSITKAAQKLHLAQPSVSMAIKEMELYYGAPLFDRISRRLYLTDTGKKLLEYARNIAYLFDESDRLLKNNANIGSLKIGSSITIGTWYMPKFVKIFKEKNPDIKIRVSIGSSDKIEESLLKNNIDFALIEATPHSENLVKKSFFNSSMSFICSNKHHFASREDVTLNELIKEDLLLRESGSGARQIVDSVFLTHDFICKPSWESTSTTALINAVAEGIGVSVLPYELIKPFKDSSALSLFRVKSIEFNRNFYFILHKNKIVTPAICSFMDICRKNIEDTPNT